MNRSIRSEQTYIWIVMFISGQFWWNIIDGLLSWMSWIWSKENKDISRPHAISLCPTNLASFDLFDSVIFLMKLMRWFDMDVDDDRGAMLFHQFEVFSPFYFSTNGDLSDVVYCVVAKNSRRISTQSMKNPSLVRWIELITSLISSAWSANFTDPVRSCRSCSINSACSTCEGIDGRLFVIGTGTVTGWDFDELRRFSKWEIRLETQLFLSRVNRWIVEKNQSSPSLKHCALSITPRCCSPPVIELDFTLKIIIIITEVDIDRSSM